MLDKDRFFVVKPLTRPAVNSFCYPFNVLIINGIEVGFFRYILPDQPIEVLVCSPLPGVVGPGEVEANPQILCDLLVVGELLPVVAGDGAQEATCIPQQLQGCAVHLIAGAALQPLHPQEPARPVVDGQDGPLMVQPDDGIRLKVAEHPILLGLLGAQGDIHPSEDDAPGVLPRPPLTVSPPLPPQVRVEGSALPLVGPNVLVDPLVGNAFHALLPAVPSDLLGAIVLPQQPVDGGPERRREPLTLGDARLALLVLALGQIGPVLPAALVAVPANLP